MGALCFCVKKFGPCQDLLMFTTRNTPAFAQRLKEYERSLRPKRGDELSMKQVACFFGGLYAIIHLLQFFDLWTLLILATLGYVLFRQAQNAIQLFLAPGEEANAVQQSAPNPKTKAAKGKKRSDAQAKS